MKVRVLYFMPDNPLSSGAGNLTRARQLLDYLKDNEDIYEVDFFSVKDWGDWDADNLKLFTDRYPNIRLLLKPRKISLKYPIKSFFFYKIPNLFTKLRRGFSVDITSFMIRRGARQIFRENDYDIAIISYASWGKIVDEIKSIKTHKIIDTHDFITAQKRHMKFWVGRLFQTELGILNKYDEIWTYSVEEEYIYQQFTDKNVVLLPVSFSNNIKETKNEYKYDIIYIASQNSHNINGARWLYKEVLPHLKNCKIHMIGKICYEVEDHPLVEKHYLVKDIDQFYRNTKLSICPMLTGTGIKIKVLEALSYGLPVVATRRGVDGLMSKANNGCLVADTGKEFANKMIKLLSDETFYEETRTMAKKYFLENHTLEHEREVLENSLNFRNKN